MFNQKRKLKRTISLVRIFVKYGFEELLIRSNIKSLLPYIFKIAIRKLSPENLKISGMKLLRTLTETLKTTPDVVHSVLAILMSGLFISSAILVLADKSSKFNRMPALALSGFLISIVFWISLLISWVSKNK